MKGRIRLKGTTGDTQGKIWEAENLLRAGRLASLEIVLDDTSVSRRHAEIRHEGDGWHLHDLGSTNGTFLNNVRLGGEPERLKRGDQVAFGKVGFSVEVLEEEKPSDAPTRENLLVEATASRTWEDAFAGLAFDRNRCLRPGEQLLALLRAGHHLVHLQNDDDLLHSILNDAVAVLDAQRGAIVLADEAGQLRIRALATGGKTKSTGRSFYSQNLANRCFSRGESILCCKVADDPELAAAQSIADGAMASVLCVLLRTPRKRLGVLHLDRSYWQKPFSQDDLQLADALAANVSAGIECAQLLRKQRELLYHTINILAQSVELRDTYTGGHTLRVTNYSVLLAHKVGLSAFDMNLVRIGTPLHDIGKIGIDDAILRKPGKLTDEEFEIMKSHTVKGAHILASLPELAPVIPIVRSHHEKWDGSGYPDKLAGEHIPPLARIVAVADAFDAMTSDRPYRKGMPPDKAFEEVIHMKGRQFDPKIADAFVEISNLVVEEKANPHGTLLVADPPVLVA